MLRFNLCYPHPASTHPTSTRTLPHTLQRSQLIIRITWIVIKSEFCTALDELISYQVDIWLICLQFEMSTERKKLIENTDGWDGVVNGKVYTKIWTAWMTEIVSCLIQKLRSLRSILDKTSPISWKKDWNRNSKESQNHTTDLCINTELSSHPTIFSIFLPIQVKNIPSFMIQSFFPCSVQDLLIERSTPKQSTHINLLDDRADLDWW